jgi:hypothetical protein
MARRLQMQITMEHHSAQYRGYWILAKLEDRWRVDIRPSTGGTQPLPVSTLLMPRGLSAGQVFDEACARVDSAGDSHIGDHSSAWFGAMVAFSRD